MLLLLLVNFSVVAGENSMLLLLPMIIAAVPDNIVAADPESCSWCSRRSLLLLLRIDAGVPDDYYCCSGQLLLLLLEIVAGVPDVLLLFPTIAAGVPDDCCWCSRRSLLLFPTIIAAVPDYCCWCSRRSLLLFRTIVVVTPENCCCGSRRLLLLLSTIVATVAVYSRSELVKIQQVSFIILKQYWLLFTKKALNLFSDITIPIQDRRYREHDWSGIDGKTKRWVFVLFAKKGLVSVMWMRSNRKSSAIAEGVGAAFSFCPPLSF